MTRSKNSDVRNDRIRSYFISAAKETILREGAGGVSVRKVAELAGYSYATLYHYFSDLNALLQAVKHEMILDLVAYMDGGGEPAVRGAEAIKMLNRKYALYYLNHPHVFRFFYSYRPGGEPEPVEQHFNYEANWQRCYQELVDDGVIPEENVMLVARTIIYTLQGLLSLYFSDNGMTREMLLSELDAVIDYLLGGHAK